MPCRPLPTRAGASEMPAPVDPRDLIGRRFGDLVVLEPAGPVPKGPRCTYLVRCDCGAEQLVPRNYLLAGRVSACDACRWRRECVICGAVFVSQQYKVLCSRDDCQREYYRRKQLESYYRRSAADPELNSRKYREKLARMQESPEMAAEYRQRELERGRRRRAAMTEEELEADRIRLREHYRANAAEIQRLRRDRWRALPAEERARLYQQWRENNRRYHEEHRERRQARQRELRDADPERYRAYKRASDRRRREAKAQAELAELAKALQDKLKPEE